MGLNSSEKGLYNFLKDEGYQITYHEFMVFYKDTKIFIDQNELLYAKATSTNDQELDDSQLSSICGGYKRNSIGIVLYGLSVSI